MQEGVSGLLARIQCVERDGDDVYVMGDDVSVPTENITALTRPPCIFVTKIHYHYLQEK